MDTGKARAVSPGCRPTFDCRSRPRLVSISAELSMSSTKFFVYLIDQVTQWRQRRDQEILCLLLERCRPPLQVTEGTQSSHQHRRYHHFKGVFLL